MKTIERGRYTCFICGGEIEYEEEDNEAVCDFCGRKYEIIDDNETPVAKIYACPGAKTCGITKCYHYKPHTNTTGCENGCFGNTGCVLQMSEPEEKTIKINDNTDFNIYGGNDYSLYQGNSVTLLDKHDLLKIYTAIGDIINEPRRIK